MLSPSVLKHVCIHGHFYQPPRENPWLEAVEKEDSAVPIHDWNQRIHLECYRSNAAARLVDERNRIIGLRNNYRSLSFNFGPTLLRWMEHHDPWVYNAILEADRESCRLLNGHGNAIAQAYNHMIMPLANRRDKITQVLWGIRDFENRFGRYPEGMWLPETAVDNETLEILAEQGIQFVILSPYQARRWRFLGPNKPWQDAGHGTIPTGRAYLYSCKNRQCIHIFFYDAALARGIAFERLLEHSGRLLEKIESAHAHRNLPKPEPWLINIATDGESYGHHFKFGDMALAAVSFELERDAAARVTNYGAFLADFPVIAEVDIFENSAWSCAHGVGRWQDDCGCHIGGGAGWNQKWRAPLREALNQLRDELAEHYEREMGRLSKDPWEVRDAYVEVLLKSEPRARDFMHRHIHRSTSAQDRHRFFQLLEMQRCAMSMFTSCGWFFDDISGLESRLILRYAARAIGLAEQTGAASLEPAFLKILEQALSNLPQHGNGADIYLKQIKPEVVMKGRVVANYAIQSLARSTQARPERFYCYTVAPQNEENLGAAPVPCLYGHIRVKDERTLEEEAFIYAVLHFGGLDFRSSVKPFTRDEEYQDILRLLQRSVEEQSTVSMVRILDEVFGTTFFSLHDAFRDLRSALALDISRERLRIYTDFQHHLYQVNSALMWSLQQWGIRLPTELRIAVRRVLSDEADQLVREILVHEQDDPHTGLPGEDLDFFCRAHLGRLNHLLSNARAWGVALHATEATRSLGRVLVNTLNSLQHAFTAPGGAKLLRLLNVCKTLDVKPELWVLQTLYHELIEEARKNPDVRSQIQQMGGFVQELDDFLVCRFAPGFEQCPNTVFR